MLTGLGLGGDDYLSKPFRIAGAAGPGWPLTCGGSPGALQYRRGGLDFDLEERAVHWGGGTAAPDSEASMPSAPISPPTPPRPSPRSRSTRRYSALTARRTPPPSRSTSRTSAPSCGPWGSPPSRPCGGGLQMGKRMRRRTGLTALFWRYLLVTGGAVVLLAVPWWGGLSALLRSGFVLPAGTAAGQADGLVRALEAGELTPGGAAPLLPLGHLRRLRPGGGAARHERAAWAMPRPRWRATAPSTASPYQQYHRSAQLPDGTVCLLQFDYSHALRLPALQGRLPRSSRPAPRRVLLAAWLAAGALSTRHFAGLLRRGARLLTAATGAIAARRLGVPWTWPGCGSWGEPGRHGAATAGPGPVSVRAVGHGAGAHPRRWPPWPTTSRPPVHRQRQRGAAGGGRPLPPPSGSAWRHSPQRRTHPGLYGAAPRPHRRRGPAEVGGRATAELSALAEGWAAAGRGLCAPGGLRFSLDCPASRPVPCSGQSWTGRCSTCWTTPPASPRRGRGAPVGVCGGGRTHRGRGGLRPRLLPEALARAGRGFTPATPAAPRTVTWAWVSPSPARPPAATAGRWSCPTPAGAGRPSPCPSEEGGAVFRAAFLFLPVPRLS